MSFLQAARTAIRKDRVSILSTAAISAVIMMSILLFGTKEDITTLSTGERITESQTATPNPDVAALYADTTEIPFTPTPYTYPGGCRNPLSVTAAEEGETIEVCGKITNFGIIECDSCPQGFYSFVRLDSDYAIVAYEWRFTYVWLGKCVKITDEVDILGDEPIFVFSKSEGCAGPECETDNQGGLIDDGGKYFEPYSDCK